MVFSLLMFTVGFLLISIGIYRYNKSFSAIFFANTPYTVANAFGSIPFGLMALCWGVAFFPSTDEIWARFLFLGGFLVGIVGTIISIRFFKPTWLKWLEQEYGPNLPLIEREAYKVGFDILDKRIKSRQDLEQWVIEVQQKYGV